MERRRFLASCAVAGSAVTGSTLAGLRDAWANAVPRLYTRTRLVDVHGRALRLRELAAETNYIFHYPYNATPCLLLKLGRAAPQAQDLKRENGTAYGWPGGVGAQRDVVAFSAICAHKLAYPTREVSFIRYQREPSATSAGQVIHCCADHSVYDPARGARVVSGPAPQPLAAIVLEHDAATDELHALGTVGAEQFDAFFDKYRMKLALEYGEARARSAAAGQVVVRELASFCKTTIQC